MRPVSGHVGFAAQAIYRFDDQNHLVELAFRIYKSLRTPV